MIDPKAAAALESPPAPDAGGEVQEDNAGASSGSFFIPKDSLGGKAYGKGDSITLQVMGEDQDGDLEVCCADDKGGDWRSELKSEVTKAGGEGGM